MAEVKFTCIMQLLATHVGRITIVSFIRHSSYPEDIHGYKSHICQGIDSMHEYIRSGGCLGVEMHEYKCFIRWPPGIAHEYIRANE